MFIKIWSLYLLMVLANTVKKSAGKTYIMAVLNDTKDLESQHKCV